MPKYLTRFLVTLVVVAAVAFTVRRMFVPNSFGMTGYYRAAAPGEIASQQPRYAGRAACQACHQDVASMKNKGTHSGLSCEVCHGASQAHVREPRSRSLMPLIKPGRSACLNCHNQSIARPSGFPMVDGLTHHPKENCQTCHASHSPSLNH